MKKTPKTIGWVLLGLSGVLVVVGGWAFLEPRLLAIEEEEITIAELPVAWDGAEIAVLGDWQIGIWADNASTVAQAAKEIVVRQPAAALLLGDYAYHLGDGEEGREALEAVFRISQTLVGSGIPVFAVLGNHDYGMRTQDSPKNEQMARRVARTLAKAGVTVLQNESVALRSPEQPQDQPLYLVGVGSRYAGDDDVAQALAGLPEDAPRIAMMHHPDSFERFPADTAPLGVAGHTHGGQIRIPFTDGFSYLTFAKHSKVRVDGWISDYGAPGNQLYINRGMGMSLLPMRINCLPELTLIRLQRGRDEPFTRS